jgi:hypothetical protein
MWGWNVKRGDRGSYVLRRYTIRTLLQILLFGSSYQEDVINVKWEKFILVTSINTKVRESINYKLGNKLRYFYLYE